MSKVTTPSWFLASLKFRETAMTRSNSEAGARFRQPTQVRTGYARRTTWEVYPYSCSNAASE